MKMVWTTFMAAVFASLVSCANGGGGGGHLSGNEGGSEPVNERESYEMQKAVNRCHRTGGTRVVKIKGELKCY